MDTVSSVARKSSSRQSKSASRPDVDPGAPRTATTNTHGRLANHGLRELNDALTEAKADVKKAQAVVAEIETEIEKRVAEFVSNRRILEQKFEGTVHVNVDGVDVESNVPKKVKWDAKLLNKAATEIESINMDPLDYIDYEPSIPERRWAEMPERIKKICAPARTVSHGKMTIKLNTEN